MPTKRYAVYETDGTLIRLSNGTNEAEVLDEFEGAEALVAEVTEMPHDKFKIETDQWYGSEGIFEMTVNFAKLETALAMFGAALKIESTIRH